MNKTYLCLIPKRTGVSKVADYRSISLVTSVNKVVAKVLSNRLRTVASLLSSLMVTWCSFLKMDPWFSPCGKWANWWVQIQEEERLSDQAWCQKSLGYVATYHLSYPLDVHFGRRTLDLILVANELVGEYKYKKKKGWVIKLDFEKA